MKDSPNIQAADSTTAAGVPSADATPQTVGQSAEMREFMRVFMLATPRSRSQICHLIQAHDAGNRRSVFAWLYHWAAFIAVNPRAAWRAVPTLRRLARVCMALVVAGVMLAVLTGCGDGAGDSSQAAALRAKYGQPAAVDNNGETTATPTPQPVQISPTETPDMQPQTFAAQDQPAQVVEVTRIVEVVQTQVQPIEVTRIVEVTPQPMQAAQIDCATLAQTPMPTIALDAADIAAGVVLRGQWQPCVSQTVTANEVRP